MHGAVELMPSPTRVIVVVLDSVGIGELPDAARYGDQGSDTLGHIAARVPLAIPNLRTLGLGRVAAIGLKIHATAWIVWASVPFPGRMAALMKPLSSRPGVSTAPGLSELTLILRGPSSLDSDSVIASMAPFVPA